MVGFQEDSCGYSLLILPNLLKAYVRNPAFQIHDFDGISLFVVSIELLLDDFSI